MTTTPPSHAFARCFNLNAIHAPRNCTPIDRQPICLEIGAGKGKHALLFAKANPDKTLFAIERTLDKFTAFEKCAKNEHLPNLNPIHADAIAWTAFAVFPKQIQTCFILYPNPEPHNKNQGFLNMPFFEFLLSRMCQNGQIVLASNITDYIDEAEKLLTDVWRLPYQKRVIESSSARTHFEIKYLARGEVCQELIITMPDNYRTRFDDVPPLFVRNAHE